MLVAYAGAPKVKKRKELAYAHFKIGRDTAAIAGMFRVTEATALRWITTQRCIEKSLPNPYRSKE